VLSAAIVAILFIALYPPRIVKALALGFFEFFQAYNAVIRDASIGIGSSIMGTTIYVLMTGEATLQKTGVSITLVCGIIFILGGVLVARKDR
jgi:hypothetical protein